jgi:hypothetical protein
MKHTRLATILLTLLFGVITAGCGAESPADGTEQGIVITRQTETDLRIAAANGESRITVTVHRTGLRETEFILDPGSVSPYEYDLIVRNRHGFPFVTSGNYGMPTDPDAGGLSLEPTVMLDQREQIGDLQLAIETVMTLQGQPGVSGRFHWELRSLFHLVNSTLNGANDMVDGRIVPEPTPEAIPPELLAPAPPSSGAGANPAKPTISGDAGVGVVRQAYTAPFSHRVGIFYDPVFWDWGDHSAVFLEIYDCYGTFVGSISTRNHGREATDPAMSSVGGACPKTYGGRANAMPPFQPYVATDTFWYGDAGGCGTSYGFTSGTHVCNDDSAAEYWNVKYNSASSWATCGDAALRQYAPACD